MHLTAWCNLLCVYYTRSRSPSWWDGGSVQRAVPAVSPPEVALPATGGSVAPTHNSPAETARSFKWNVHEQSFSHDTSNTYFLFCIQVLLLLMEMWVIQVPSLSSAPLKSQNVYLKSHWQLGCNTLQPCATWTTPQEMQGLFLVS